MNNEIIEELVRQIAALEKRLEYLETVEKNVFSTVTVDGTTTFEGLTIGPEIRIDLYNMKNSGQTVTASATTAATITVTRSHHRVAGFGDAASVVQTIDGGAEGDILVLQAYDSNVTITLDDGADNIQLAGDFAMDHRQDTITLIFAGGGWIELSRSNNNV